MVFSTKASRPISSSKGWNTRLPPRQCFPLLSGSLQRAQWFF
jgi:hypothetical protein